MRKNKIFIISLHKTGTTCLSRFFEKMGYLVTGPDTHLFTPALNNDYKEIDKFIKCYDVFQDDPWYMIYPYLYKNFPNAKFIFLERDETSWIKSVQNFYGRDKYNNANRRRFYGDADTISNKTDYLKKYRFHNQQVKDYFKSRDNFISISISNNSDAIKLQKFLGEPIRFKSFPHKNRTPKNIREKRNRKFIFMIKGGFGMKFIFKKQLQYILGYDNFIRFRTQIRLFKSKFRVFFIKLIKSKPHY